MRLGAGLETACIPPVTACPEDRIAFTRPEDYFEGMCKFTLAFDREDDGRFIAEVQEIPGALAYSATQAEAKARVQAIALHALAERIERGKDDMPSLTLFDR